MNRGTVWTDKEVRALIAIWGDSTTQEELDGAVRNKAVYQRIAMHRAMSVTGCNAVQR